jgi:hypothetical protein
MTIDSSANVDNDELRKLLKQVRADALRDPEITDQAREAGLGAVDLEKALAAPEGELLASCESSLAELDRLDAEIALVEAAIRERLVDPVREAAGQRLGVDLHSHAAKPPTDAGRARRAREALDSIEQQVEEAMAQDSRLGSLRERRAEIMEALRSQLQRSLLHRLRLTINNRIAERARRARHRRFREELRRLDAQGLRDEENKATIVQTRAHRDLTILLDVGRTTRASIGVAGPRGCGKSTLLRRTCEEWRGNGLRIFLPAPVSYMPREFLLHLYDKICQEVRRRDPDPRLRNPPITGPAGRTQAVGLLGLVVLPVLVVAVGLALLAADATAAARAPTDARFAGLGGAVLVVAVVPLVLQALQRWALPLLPDEEESSAESAVLIRGSLGWRLPGLRRCLAPTALAGVLLLLSASALVPFLTIRHTIGIVLLAAAIITAVFWPPWPWWRGDTRTETPIVSDSDKARLQRVLADARRNVLVTTAAAAQLAIALAGVALLVVPETFASIGLRTVGGATLTAAGLVARAISLAWRGRLDHDRRHAAEKPGDSHTRQAIEDLNRLRYQRSVMSGWTSSVKVTGASWLPFGLDAGMSGSLTEAETPLTMPDIVEGIKRLLPVRGPAVVAIDELDKLESADKAREFLNEIKGIFETRGTHFLVSMSEDAIASFERRGLPFRDVFDSAFDEVVRVPYLTAQQSRKLLDERIIGLPPPFMALAYCQSAGLPRDLLRATRRMVGLVRNSGTARSLTEVTRTVVHRDLAGKTEAVTTAIKSIPVEPDVSEVLRVLQRLDSCSPPEPRRGPCLLDASWLAAVEGLTLEIGSAGSDDKGDRRTLARLAVELIGYFYYCRTLLELFDVDTEEKIERLIGAVENDNGRALDILARALQDFSINPFLAWQEVTEFRQSQGIDSFDLPSPLKPYRQERLQILQDGNSTDNGEQTGSPKGRKKMSTASASEIEDLERGT